ncbi:MAG TPA: hypothetical protein VK604_22545 [Bryobacteraceae bacterium]|nr:hypothetical protein [Bryobacteraceae bacterium]
MSYKSLLANLGLIVSLSCLPAAALAGVDTPPPGDIIRGKVLSVGRNALQLSTPSGPVTVKTFEPLNVYASHSASLSDVKSYSFIGVSSVTEPDGSQRATEVHIFPEALRGLGEGSYIMAPAAGAASGSRMTNGEVAVSKAASGSRMTNGVVKSNGEKLVVEFNGGKQIITVPPDVPVTEIRAVDKSVSAGDTIVLQAKKDSGGTLFTRMVMLRNLSVTAQK